MKKILEFKEFLTKELGLTETQAENVCDRTLKISRDAFMFAYKNDWSGVYSVNAWRQYLRRIK